MKIFHEFTRRCLKENRIRTIATVIGIALSMALMTAVIEGAHSGISFLQRSIISQQGSWTAGYLEADDSDLETLRAQKDIRRISEWTEVGWADSGSDYSRRPYVLIESMGEGFADLVSVSLLDGRMPENENEILLPDNLSKDSGAYYANGSVLELAVGKRTTLDDRIIERTADYLAEEEKLSRTVRKDYTVVGHYTRLDMTDETFYCPGYIYLTVGSADGTRDVFYELNNPMSFDRFSSRLFGELGFDSSKAVSHYDLLHVYGVVGNADVRGAIRGFAAILIILIFFGSVSVIYNSFSISVSERTRLFGLLKSIGATKKQIRSTVSYEACFLAGIGIPIGLVTGCLGIGITLYALRDAFSGIMDTPSDVKMKLVLSPGALLLSAVICFITTMVSANRPAERAIRISPIEAVRQTQDINIKAKEVKTSKLTQLLFGFEGMLASKNFKRNKKRYRSVVLSLFMSVVLFITASSFCSYLTSSVKGATGYGKIPDICYSTRDQSMEDDEETLKLLMKVQGVRSGYMFSDIYEYISFNHDMVDEKLQQSEYADNRIKVPGSISVYYPIYLVDDDTFAHWCEMSGADPEELGNKNDPKGLMINKVIREELPSVCHMSVVKDIEGYELYRIMESEDGSYSYQYYPEDYLDDYRYGNISQLDPANALILSVDDAVMMTPLTIGAFASKEVAGELDEDGAVIYPYSVAETVFGKETADEYTYYHNMIFYVDGHEAVYDQMRTILSERGLDPYNLRDYAEDYETEKMAVTVINVFSYGFVILISLIALANVFNTISTNVILRRRELAMLKSVGMSEKGFNKMMNYECIIYGIKGLGFGIPVSVLTTFAVYMVARDMFDELKFFIPVGSFAVAIGSVFAVVFATMIFSMNKIRNDNPIDALKNENI